MPRFATLPLATPKIDETEFERLLAPHRTELHAHCNCTFCRKARFWMAIVKADLFRLLAGAEALVDYQNTPPGRPDPFLHLSFCGRCGVRPFTRGGFMPALGGAFYAVNLACLDNVTDDELVDAPVRYVNGKQDDWQTPFAGETRHL